jgi:hypothetical protein
VKLAVLAKSHVFSQVIDGPKLKFDFVVSSGLAKSFRLKFLIPGSLVRVQPGVLQKLAGTMPAHREPTEVGQAKRGTMPRLCVKTVRWFESSRAYEKHWQTSAFLFSGTTGFRRPAPILKNPQICTWRRSLGDGVGLVFRTRQQPSRSCPLGGHGRRANEDLRGPRGQLLPPLVCSTPRFSLWKRCRLRGAGHLFPGNAPIPGAYSHGNVCFAPVLQGQ